MSENDFRTADDREAAEAGRAADEAVKGRDGGPFNAADAEAAEGLTVSPEQAANYEEMLERGAHQKGEGAPEA